MATQDMHYNISVVQGNAPQAAYTGNTAIVSNIIDTSGYESVEFIINLGSLADADATFAVTMDDGDASNLSDAAAVAAQYILGTYAGASFTFAADNSVKTIGYVGHKRYVRLTITPSNNTGNAYIDVVVVKGFPRNAPTSTYTP